MKEIKLIQSEENMKQLRTLAARIAVKDRRYRMSCVFFYVLSAVFLAFAVYSAVYLIGADVPFQFGMLIYILVPLVGAVLPFSFIRLKKRDLIEEICEESNTVMGFSEHMICVSGERKRKLVYKPDGRAVFENGASVLRESDGRLIPFRYDIRLSELRYYAYDAEQGRLRLILGSMTYPDLILPECQALDEIREELEKRGIKKTAFLK